MNEQSQDANEHRLKTDVFTIREGVWQIRIGDDVLSIAWNSRGAALAGLKTELRRRTVRVAAKIGRKTPA